MLLSAVLLLSVIGSVACSSSTSPGVERSAAGESGATCPEQSSFAFRGSFINTAPFEVTLSAPRSKWDCEDYSGVSTPSAAFDNVTIRPGGWQTRLDYRLEIAAKLIYSSYWTLNVRGDGKEASACLQVKLAGKRLLVSPVTASDCMQSYTPLGWSPWYQADWIFVPLWSANAPNTSRDEVNAALNGFDSDVAAVFGYHNNQFGLIWTGEQGGNVNA
jgi:hypothetical protein